MLVDIVNVLCLCSIKQDFTKRRYVPGAMEPDIQAHSINADIQSRNVPTNTTKRPLIGILSQVQQLDQKRGSMYNGLIYACHMS